MIADMNAGCFIGDEPYWKEGQRLCREGMAEAGFSLQKNFWVFGYLDSDQFHFSTLTKEMTRPFTGTAPII